MDFQEFHEKRFMSPDSPTSMAAIKTSVFEDGIVSLKISDCNRSIEIWNDINKEREQKEMLEKLDVIKDSVERFKSIIEARIYKLNYYRKP